MNFERFEEVKAKLEKLPNVGFYSFNEDSVILTNKKNGSLYQIPFSEEVDESLTLYLKDGEKVKDGEPTLEEQYFQNKNRIKNGIKKIFSNYNEGIEEMKEVFKTMPNIDVEQFQKEESKTITFEEKINLLCNSENEVVKNINTKFKKQILEAEKDKQEFIQLFHIFDEEGNLKDHEFNFKKLQSMYEESESIYKNFEEKLLKMKNFQDKLTEIFEDEKLARNFINNFDFVEEQEVSIPKTLVSLVNTYTEDTNISVNKVAKKIKKLYNEMFDNNEENPIVFNRHRSYPDEKAPSFLKFSNGKYSRVDVETLTHELEQAFYIVPDLNHDDLMQIGDWRNQCEYMSRANIISDKKVDEIIHDFNKKFATNSDEMFNDGEQSLGFKDTEEMSMDNAEGFHDNIGETNVEDADIEGELESPEDVEDFEEQKDLIIK